MIEVPSELAENLPKYYGDRGRHWLAALPDAIDTYLQRWSAILDGSPMHGVVGLVLPVKRAEGEPAVIKLQITDPEHPGEPQALRTWGGDGAVRLLDFDETEQTSAMLLERLHLRDLTSVPDPLKAVEIIANLLARLHRHEPPAEARPLADIAAGMLAYVPDAVRSLPDAEEADLVRDWAARVAEVASEPGNALLHWDLHFENVLAADREPWLAIDPKPLRGEPGFDILPVLHNRWDEIISSDDPRRAILRRYDLAVEVLGLDRSRADAWTVGRTLQNTLWEIEDGEHAVHPVQRMIAETITHRPLPLGLSTLPPSQS
jgi:streptomycin 6-kinase